MSEVIGNPYEAPKADVNAQAFAPGPSGSVEDAVAGRYDFEIGQVMSEAWDLTRGMKASFWGAAAVVYALFLVLALIVGAVAGKSVVIRVFMNIVTGAISPVLMMGLLLIGIRRAVGLPISAGTAFGCLDRAVPAMIAGILTTVLTYVGLALLAIPGIYLAIAYIMTMPLIVDRRLPPWQAMETSRRALSKHWFKFFGLMILMGLIILVSAIPLGIGLVWTAPWSVNVFGVAYRRTFGVAQTT